MIFVGIAIGIGICLLAVVITLGPALLMGYSEWAYERKAKKLRRKYGDRYWERDV